MRRGTRRSYRKAGRGRLQRALLGVFTNFPTTIHGFARATYEDRPVEVQRSIIRSLRKLNGLEESYQVSPSSRAGTFRGRVGFEVGVAEGVYFNFLDDEMAKRLCDPAMLRKPYLILDFLVIVTYNYNFGGKKVHLNFDYHQLRFIFNDGGFEMRLFHIKGTRNMPLDELANKILEGINREMKEQFLSPLNVEELNVL